MHRDEDTSSDLGEASVREKQTVRKADVEILMELISTPERDDIPGEGWHPRIGMASPERDGIPG